jgi:uncharacterized protein YecT (DUF1311 family)
MPALEHVSFATLAACMSLLTMVSAGAQQPAKEIDCTLAANTVEITACAELRIKQAEAEVALAFDKARARIAKHEGVKPEDRSKWTEALEASQKAWSAFRDIDCSKLLPHEWQGNASATLATVECRAQMTEQRAFDLNERYSENR